ncbi:phospholipase A2, membrane associated-like [Dermochelys coriacea]|uniref:phospholipase A2, membrane associated-like n=1 Tax=Dermochelys coriacea TaxID=27794 RepID=UPI001CA9192C|nr:phospholipase A2, membrane associated-like [Dermochelys coriacea]
MEFIGTIHSSFRGDISLPSSEFNVFLCSFTDVGMAHGNALEFNKMIKAATGKCALFSYYGCYCGLGGKETLVTYCSDQSQCRREACLCHRSTALCFQRILVTHNKSYWVYSNRPCKGSKASC